MRETINYSGTCPKSVYRLWLEAIPDDTNVVTAINASLAETTLEHHPDLSTEDEQLLEEFTYDG